METTPICPNCRKPLPPDTPMGLCPECLMKSGLPTSPEPPPAGDPGAARFVPPPVGEIARLFPQLEIISFLGQGGMGAVYKARQPALDRLVALKILPPAVAGDPGFAERFNREARALARLNHPNIVAVYDFGKAGELHYLLMEFVDGSNLREVEQVARLSPEQALAIVPQICEALQFAHNEGVVHRDVKPENILLDKKGRVKMADFGIAKIVGTPTSQVRLTGAKDVMGTPHYMAPEQVEKPQTVDHRADIYSLGVVFYEMLTGELPLGKFAPPSRKVQVDVRLDEVVLHTLEKEPERRYQQASQVKTDVEAITNVPAGVALGAPPPLVPPSPATVATGSDKTILPAFLLATFLGPVGAHRFYVGKFGTASLQLAALAGCILLIEACAVAHRHGQPLLGLSLAALICTCFFWVVVDWILILGRAFTDGQGRRITNWIHPDASGPSLRANPPGGQPPKPPMAGGLIAGDAHLMITAPAAVLMAAGLWNLLRGLAGLGWVGAIFGHLGIHLPFHLGGMVGMSIVLLKIVPAIFILFGAIQMMQIRGYAWAVAAAIVAIVACSVLGFIAGVWALIVLLRADVRNLFASRANLPPSTASKWPWVLAAAGVTVLILFTVGLFLREEFGSWSETDESTPSELSGLKGLSKLSKLSKLSELSQLSKLSALTNLARLSNVSGSDLSSLSNLSQLSNLAAAVDQFDAAPSLPGASNAAPLPTASGTNFAQPPNSLPGAEAMNRTIDVGSEAHFSMSLPIGPVGQLKINVAEGGVTVTGANQNTVDVRIDREVTRAGGPEAARLLKEEHVLLKQTGTGIAITSEEVRSLRHHSFWGWLTSPNVDAHYDITVPKRFDISVDTSGGGIKLALLQGNARVKTQGGGLDFVDMDGKVNGQTQGGGIHAMSCQNELLVETQGGGISIERFSGPRVRATTEGGGISADFADAPAADSELRTEGGSVTAWLPGDAALTLDAHTEGGSVKTDFPVQIEGRFEGDRLKGPIHGGGPLLKLVTEGGNIQVLKR